MTVGAARVGYGRGMDDDAALDVLRAASDALARCAAQDPDRSVPTYPNWSVADLVIHTGRIHRWVTAIVVNQATQRIPQPEFERLPADVIGWFRDGAAAVAAALAATSASTIVWTFAGDGTVSFWRRRMALETTVHRWDTQRAFGVADPIADDVAAAGVTEALEIYLEPRLRGAQVGGDGEVVVLRAVGDTRAWAVRLHSDAIEVVSADHPAEVRIEGTSADLWLFLMGRIRRDGLRVHGPEAAADRLEEAVGLLAPPSR